MNVTAHVDLRKAFFKVSVYFRIPDPEVFLKIFRRKHFPLKLDFVQILDTKEAG
jgi:hypothetical protein